MGIFISAGIAVLASLIIFLGIKDAKEWEKFKLDHECILIGKMRGETFTTFGIGSNGQSVVGVGTTSGKSGWKCNDDITYWR